MDNSGPVIDIVGIGSEQEDIINDILNDLEELVQDFDGAAEDNLERFTQNIETNVNFRTIHKKPPPVPTVQAKPITGMPSLAHCFLPSEGGNIAPLSSFHQLLVRTTSKTKINSGQTFASVQINESDPSLFKKEKSPSLKKRALKVSTSSSSSEEETKARNVSKSLPQVPSGAKRHHSERPRGPVERPVMRREKTHFDLGIVSGAPPPKPKKPEKQEKSERPEKPEKPEKPDKAYKTLQVEPKPLWQSAKLSPRDHEGRTFLADKSRSRSPSESLSGRARGRSVGCNNVSETNGAPIQGSSSAQFKRLPSVFSSKREVKDDLALTSSGELKKRASVMPSGSKSARSPRMTLDFSSVQATSEGAKVSPKGISAFKKKLLSTKQPEENETVVVTKKDYNSYSPLWDTRIIFNEDRVAIAGPLPAVLKWALACLPDLEPSSNLIYAHRQYCTSEHLIDTILDLWNFDFSQTKDKLFVHLRIVRFFCLWFESHIQCFIPESMNTRINNFLASLSESQTESSMCILLFKCFHDAVENYLQATAEYESGDCASKTNLNASHSGGQSLLDFSTKEIAHQLTLRDYGLMTALPVGELLNKRFEKSETSPHLSYIVDTFNTTTRWIATELLSATNIKQQAKILSNFISIGHKLIVYNNDHGFMAFYTALTQNNLKHMKEAFNHLSAKDLEKWEILNNYANPIGNFKVIREKYKTTETQLPPSSFVKTPLLFLKDLTMVEEAYQDFTDPEKTLINITKMNFLGTIVGSVCGHSFSFSGKNSARSYINKLSPATAEELKEMAQKQLALEETVANK
eukprot:TRINITY_DN2424_c0_g1_i1.p1 TRINITY_DN2424_c0_g1~~TRINITY_DN2424_c0_g1_i1.p1  ORF type:complete len:804 (+),score=144.21 TRINITY_DN2424_c0_g1_i1:44-2455(+)